MAEQFKQRLNGDDSEAIQTRVLTDNLLLDLNKEELCKSEELLLKNVVRYN